MTIWLFLRAVAVRPLQMGAIVPSSPELARRMVDEARIVPGNVVLELGAGSGSFTQEIVRRHPENPLLAVEPSPALAGHLRQAFPTIRVSERRAEEMGDIAREHGVTRVDRVVSGLPWALWTREHQATILDGLMPLLSPQARLVTFHYVHSRALARVRSMRELLDDRFESVSDGTPVWGNLPPAYVHSASQPRG